MQVLSESTFRRNSVTSCFISARKATCEQNYWSRKHKKVLEELWKANAGAAS
jgi:hypothetical protein